MKSIKMLLIGLLLLGFTGTALAEDKPYKDGPVLSISYIKTKPGKFDDYMAFLDTTYKTLMEANKKAGLILNYAVFSAEARTPQEPDLILTITYANMAALDKTEEADAVAAKVLGSVASMNKATVDRGAMRDVLGSQLIRELILK